MKKSLIITFICLGIIVLSGLIGLYIYKIGNLINEQEDLKTSELIEDECTILGQTYQTKQAEESVETNSSNQKVSPNAQLIIKKYYDECGHTTNQYAEVPEDMVNKTKEDIQEMFIGWVLESFSDKEVILIKNEQGFCNEHYLLKSENGYIKIYLLDKDNNPTLYQETQIETKYLTNTDLINLEEGIIIYGKESLNSLIEDFE